MPKKDGPFTVGRYRWDGGGAEPPTADAHLDVWSYRTATREEFHLNVYDGARYVGHLTFTQRLAPKAARGRKGGR